jgi:hypothetical protein
MHEVGRMFRQLRELFCRGTNGRVDRSVDGCFPVRGWTHRVAMGRGWLILGKAKRYVCPCKWAME